VTRVVALFESPSAVQRAVEEMKRAGWRTITVCSPSFDEHLLQAVGATASPVSVSALVGGVLGVMCGFLLTIGTVRQWPGLIVSGKPLVAMPPFLIVVFELAILVAAIGAVASFLTAARSARRAAPGACNNATTDSRFALLVESAAESGVVGELLRKNGAVEWRRV
jgi:hypothetical protein